MAMKQKKQDAFQPSLFDQQTPFPKKEPISESIRKAGKKAIEVGKKGWFNKWKKVVEEGLCRYPDKMQALESTPERKAFDYQLSGVMMHYLDELGVCLAILDGYDNAKEIVRIAKNGLGEIQLERMQKVANSLLVEARYSRSSDDLANASAVVMLVALLAHTNRIKAMLSRGEVISPVKEYFVALERKKRRGIKFAKFMLSDMQLYSAAERYAQKAYEMAKQ
ncbi:MAG: hypothetical protein N3F07_00085 [Candidatus Micrarchaeota archaeon]|nr:hypothetical protein [Candidatus Micrarchaeota archaeon]